MPAHNSTYPKGGFRMMQQLPTKYLCNAGGGVKLKFMFNNVVRSRWTISEQVGQISRSYFICPPGSQSHIHKCCR